MVGVWMKVSEVSGSEFNFFFSSRRRHTRSLRDWSSDVCSSDLMQRPRNARDRRPKAQLLKAPGIELAGRAQAMSLLKLPHGLGGGLIPFPAGSPRVRTVLCEIGRAHV